MAKIYGNRWLVKKSLNEGGQSVVFIVEDRTGNLPGEYALKQLKRKDRVTRFRNEAPFCGEWKQEHHQACGRAGSGRRQRS
jgi:hypothetical protein